jgi:hypothetical protein
MHHWAAFPRDRAAKIAASTPLKTERPEGMAAGETVGAGGRAEKATGRGRWNANFNKKSRAAMPNMMIANNAARRMRQK